MGFDLRVVRDADNPWFPEYLLREDVKTVVSVDPLVCPIPISEQTRRSQIDNRSKENFFGLLMSPPQISTLGPHEFKIAVSISEEVHIKFTEKFSAPSTSGSLSTTSDLISDGWIPLGYDVIDINRLISGLLNCGPYSVELKERFAPHINRFGLFDELSIAKKYAEIRGIEIPAHSPFYPALLWKKP